VKGPRPLGRRSVALRPQLAVVTEAVGAIEVNRTMKTLKR